MALDLTDPCGWCDRPKDGHGVRYTAGRGDHTWEEPRGNWSPPVLQPRVRTDRPVQVPRAVRADDGGLAMEWVPEPPSDRLPARENPAPEREPGGVSSQDTPPASARQGIIRRILNARKANT